MYGEIAVDAILADVREPQLIGAPVSEDERVLRVDHPVVRIELDLPVVQRLAALEIFADGRRDLALPAKAQAVSALSEVHPRKRAQRLDDAGVGVVGRNRRRRRRKVVHDGVLDQVALEVEEEERLVANDGTADVEAEGVASALRVLGDPFLLQEGIEGAQALVLEVVEAAPGERVGARLGDGVHHDA